MATKKESNAVTVGVRIRPRNEKEINAGMPVSFRPTADGHSAEELNEDDLCVKTWSYDNVFGPNCNNKTIFESMGKDLVEASLDGYNTVLFMYGQTSSGKTFTLFGGGTELGLVSHAMEYVFDKVRHSTDTEYVIKLQYAELYNEELKDLLSEVPNENLRIIEDPILGPLIQNITEATFKSPADVKRLLDEGESRRHFGITNMNAHSSRSHVLVRLSIESRKVAGKTSNPLRGSWGKDKPQCVSTLNLVDLAGSERANKSGTSGASLKEGSFINKSLLTLGTVIASLSDGKNSSHIPYRDSKLTRLLASALGGNAKTCMITCISPASGNVSESLSTLRFASRAKRIVNKVSKGEIMDAKTLLAKLGVANTELESLKALLEQSRQLGFGGDEAGDQANSLKAKAILASRCHRNLKFLMQTSARLIQGLRGAGLSQLANKVHNDVKMAIQKKGDLSDCVEEFRLLITTYLKKDTKLVDHVERIIEENDGEYLIGQNLGSFEDDTASDDEDEFAAMNGGLMDVGSEELQEQIELALFGAEEYRVFAHRQMLALQAELQELVSKEKQNKKQLGDIQTSATDLKEQLGKAKLNEISLLKQLDDFKRQLEEEIEKNDMAHRKHEETVQHYELKAMEEKKSQSLKTLMRWRMAIRIKTMEKQRDQLNRDLDTALRSKAIFEAEASKARSDLRVQMDRLRSNMHDLLIEGGEETKFLEDQNIALEKQLDNMRDCLEVASVDKERLEMELKHLRHDIEQLYDRMSEEQQVLSDVRNEATANLHKFNESQITVNSLQGNIAALENANNKLHGLLTEEKEHNQILLDAKDAEYQQLKNELTSRMRELNQEIDTLEMQTSAATEELSAKHAHFTKMEHSLSNDLVRVEKKLQHQIKLCEELNAECAAQSTQAQVVHGKHLTETKNLRLKIAEMQSFIDSVNQMVELKVQESDNYKSEVDSESATQFEAPITGRSYSITDSIMSDGEQSYSYVSPHIEEGERDEARSGGGTFSPAASAIRSAMYKGRSDSLGTADSNVSFMGSPNTKYIQAVKQLRESNHKFSTRYDEALSQSFGIHAHGGGTDDVDGVAADRYTAIISGLKLVTASLRYACGEQSMLKRTLLQQNLKAHYQAYTDHSLTTTLLEEKRNLIDAKNYLIQCVDFLSVKNEQLADKIDSLQLDHDTLKSNLSEVLQTEIEVAGQADQIQQNYLDASIQLERARSECTETYGVNTDLVRANGELQVQLDRTLDEMYVLKNKYELMEQQLGVAQAERDEVFKRFIKTDLSSF